MFRPSRGAVLCLLALTTAVAPPLRAQDAHELESIEAALRASRSQSARLSTEAAALAKMVADLQYQLVARAAAAREAEAQLSRLEGQLSDLEARAAAGRAALAGRRQALVLSLAALERLAMTPPGAALASAAPLDLARGEILLAAAIPELQRRAQLLERDLARLQELAREIAGRRQRAEALAANLDADRQKIASLLSRKAELQKRTAAAAAASDARSARLAAEAKDLRDLLQRLARERVAVPTPAPASVRAFPSGGGGLVSPVVGPIVQRFGTAEAAGSTAKGIVIRTRPGSPVLAPFDGQVVFRGPFRSYGEILIIQHGGGYHSLLAGLGRCDAAVGQWVLAGEPVGVMGSPEDGNAKLYIELRRDGHPIDPAPWLGKTATTDTNVE
ncbi:MAG TPA: peptidoglycan DD-metalloendopeptidase family protein [Dongiaceae bacterium]|nr:peptidoglycan DD-metalloendopeptidase family protein [Dongiaceae bacterium]